MQTNINTRQANKNVSANSLGWNNIKEVSVDKKNK